MEYGQFTLRGGRIGIERETLRTQPDGQLARSFHPRALGSAFSHPHITIDYGEALLELVTGARTSVESAYDELKELHQFCAQNIGDELLWPASMPCILPENEEDIEIGHFGTSNSGRIRRLYRLGLAQRYGRYMQMIAGIHFNYSPPPELFAELARLEGVADNQAFRNQRFMGMLRSLQRVSWLVCYLYGASPLVDRSFLPARSQLSRCSENTLGWANATTLRMSNLGYQNKVDFAVSFDNLESYTHDLISAVLTPAPAYEYLGLKNADGSYKQISVNILQIENEYYTAARPKQLTRRGELPSLALRHRGIAYVELRLLDVNPWDPCGISLEQMRVLEALMLWALLNPTPAFGSSAWNEQNTNRLRTACCGLSPDIQLSDRGHRRPIQEWAAALLQQLLPVASALGEPHRLAVEALLSREELPAQRQQREVQGREFVDWALALAQQHRQVLLEPLFADRQAALTTLAQQSLQQFEESEAAAATQLPFDQYLQEYFAPLATLSPAD